MHPAVCHARTVAEMVRGVPLNVVFAESGEIEAIREAREGSLALLPPFHVSDQDAYLVLPDDIGLEIVDMFRDGDVDLLEEAMRDGLVAIGTIEKQGAGKLALSIERSARPREVLDTLPWAETVRFGRGINPLPALNALDHVQCTVASAFFDDVGLAAVLSAREFAGLSWRVPEKDKHLAHVDPTYVWSKRLPDGRIGVECALFSEYEELVVVLRPVVLAPVEDLAVAPPAP
jgi:hypothetical protein